MLLNNQWIIRKQKWKHSTPKFMDASKIVLTGKFTATQAYYLKKKEKLAINNLTLLLKELEKGEQTKPKVSRKKKNKN